MRILLDMNLSPAWVQFLTEAGYDVMHWSEVGPANATDTEIMEWARNHSFIVFTHDLDYGSLLFSTKAVAPSVIQLRCEDIRPTSVGRLILQALNDAERQLLAGALVTVDARKNRIHLLPFKTN